MNNVEAQRSQSNRPSSPDSDESTITRTGSLELSQTRRSSIDFLDQKQQWSNDSTRRNSFAGDNKSLYVSSSDIKNDVDSPQLPEPEYHIFERGKKKQLIYIVSAAALFSPLSSNIYFPAMGQISKASHLLQAASNLLTSRRNSTSPLMS